jgi:hypothetical protein
MNNNQQHRKQVLNNHQLNIQKSLQHRLEVARAKGDQNLLRQLEAESQYYN